MKYEAFIAVASLAVLPTCSNDDGPSSARDSGGFIAADASIDTRIDAGAQELDEVLIAAGTFLMGSPDKELGHGQDERLHSVTLTRAYMMMATEVTQAQWLGLLSDNPSVTLGAEYPVDSVSWYDALAYANALSESRGLELCYDLAECTGTPGAKGFGVAYLCPDGDISFELTCTGYRLPTEAEWEYAARAGETGPGKAVCDGDANLNFVSCMGSGYNTNPPQSTTPNAWGLYGTQGNVGEWVWDLYDNYLPGDQIDPLGPPRYENHSTRGGGWTFNARGCRLAHRNGRSPSCQNDSMGIRLVRTVP